MFKPAKEILEKMKEMEKQGGANADGETVNLILGGEDADDAD